MLLLNENSSLYNLQTLIVNKAFHSSLIGRYVIVNLEKNRSFLCRIWKRSPLHSGCCILDTSVEIYHNSCPKQVTNIDRSRIFFENIEVVPKIGAIKSLNIFIVFKNPWERLKWICREAALTNALRDLLKLFVICSDSFVHVDKLKEFDLFGIYAIRVVSIGSQGVGKVIRSTKIKIDDMISFTTYDQLQLQRPFDTIIHLDAYDDIKRILTNRQGILEDNKKKSQVSKEYKNPSLHFLQQVLLIGPGGCGKTTLLKKVCYDQNTVLLPLEVSDIFSLKYEDRKLFFSNQLKLACALASETKSGLCLILIQRIENIISKSGKRLSLINSFLEEASCFPSVIIVATTDSPMLLNSSLRAANKFSVELYLSIPSEDDRSALLTHLCSKLGVSEESCRDIARSTPGFVLSDLVLLIRRASKLLSLHNNQSDEKILLAINSCIQTVEPASARSLIGLKVPNSDFDLTKLGGLDDIKKKLIQVIAWPILHADSFRLMNIPQPSGVLLYGPPGCAKTSLVRAVSSSCKTTFLSVSAADLYSAYVGDAEKTITQLFQQARASAPTILFIDEIDALVGSRNFREKGVQERVLSSFLTELDGVGFKRDAEHSVNEKYCPVVIVIAATNRPQIIDSALLRPGRLDKLIYVPPPCKEDRLDILCKITGKMSLDCNLSLSSVAGKTENYSGADLVNLCREAGLHALTVGGMDITCINEDNFNYALNSMKPSLNPQQISWYNKFTFG